MTQTPASAPFGPVTTPAMSSPSIATSAAGDCDARIEVKASRAVQVPVSSRNVRRVCMRLLGRWVAGIVKQNAGLAPPGARAALGR